MKDQIKEIVNFPILLTLFVALVFTSCSDVAGPGSESLTKSEDYNSEQNLNLGISSTTISANSCINETSVTLKASKRSIDAGTLTYSMDAYSISVTYSANSGWGISETHLWVGNNLIEMPAAGNGAPKNGHFPYSDHHDPVITDYTYDIPLVDVGISPGDDVYIVAHAVVGKLKGGSLRKTETAYAGENEGDSPRWWWYIQESTYEYCHLFGGGTE